MLLWLLATTSLEIAASCLPHMFAGKMLSTSMLKTQRFFLLSSPVGPLHPLRDQADVPPLSKELGRAHLPYTSQSALQSLSHIYPAEW